MLAVAPPQESEALAGTILGLADPGVVKRAKPRTVQSKASAADLAGDFAKGVKGGLAGHVDAKDPHAVLVGRSDNRNHPRVSCLRLHHVPILAFRELRQGWASANPVIC